MKERILKIKERTQMTQRDFAAALGISPSSLSSIFNGHTSPTNNLVQAIHRRFPEISIEWLMFGEGEMIQGDGTEQAAAAATPNNAPSTPATGNVRSQQKEESHFVSDGESEGLFQSGNKEVTPAGQTIIREVKYIDKPQRQITEIRVFYDDGTFDVFPGKRD